MGLILADPSGELTALHDAAGDYPPALATTVVTKTLWEASFSVEIARTSISRMDTAYVAGCVFRAVTPCAHAIHARAGRWLINEKGSIPAAGQLPSAPEGFTTRTAAILGELGTTAPQLSSTLDRAHRLVDDARTACSRTG